jgi:hypothetical protein
LLGLPEARQTVIPGSSLEAARSSRWYRPAMAGIAFGLLIVAVVETVWGIRLYHWGDTPGIDIAIYGQATERLLSGQPWFLDRQIHGPYTVAMGDVLYPPVAAILFAPFLVIPLFLWWAIPFAVVALLIWRWHPAPWTWPLLALCVAWPLTPAKVITGNPTMWIAAFTALGLQVAGPAALVLLKPSLFPFALIGSRSRAWWLIAVILVVASIPVLAETVAYPAVVLNGGNEFGLLYSLMDVPMVLIPVVAWLGRRTDRARSEISEPRDAIRTGSD